MLAKDAVEANLNRPTSATQEVIPLLKTMFDHVFQEGVDYRATMVVLGKLEPDIVRFLTSLTRDKTIDLSCWLQSLDPDMLQEGNTVSVMIAPKSHK